MIYSIFADKDTTIYNNYKKMNTGLDEIIELRKSFYRIWEGTIAETFTTESALSRILMKFDITSISESIAAGTITTPSFYLKLRTATAEKIGLTYTASVHPVSQSWDMGTGKKASSPIIVNGASWNFNATGSAWSGSVSVPVGGATWHTQSAYTATKEFSYETTDLTINVSNIVNAWISGAVVNEGFIIKYPDAAETDVKEYGVIKFFSRDTHTIYPPTLEVRWDDSAYSTGSLTALSSTDLDDMVFTVNGLKENYTLTEKPKIRMFARERFPVKTYVTSSRFITSKYLPSSSYYSIKDAHTEEVVIPFDTGSTKISCDTTGNYLNIWTSGLQPERYYRMLFKVVDGTREQIIDKNFIFKIVR